MIACLGLALVAMTMMSHAYSTDSEDRSNRNEDQGTSKNPCKEVWENMTVSTPEGLVFCMVPSDEELTVQLKNVGGYNKHYVAVTPEEAVNFEPILPGWDGAATTKPTKPSSTRRCRRYRKRHPSFRKRRGNWKRSAGLEKLGWEDEKDDPEIENIQTKRNDKSAYRRMALREQDDNDLQRSKRSLEEGVRESIKVGCVSKGDEIRGSRFKQMCDRCQRRTELTADRFPRYINEVTCESASGSPSDKTSQCKPSFGVCAQGYLLIDLLMRTDQYTDVSPPSGMYFKALKQIWVPYTHKIRSCCECRSSF